MERSGAHDPGSWSAKDWGRGYEAAIEDAVGLIDAMGAQSGSSLSSPLLAYVRARLAELPAKRRSAAA